MKSNNCFSRKGFIKPIWLNNMILWILVVLSYALFDFILVNTHDLTALENAVCFFGLCMGVFFIIDCFSYVKIDADKKSLRVWELSQICPKTYCFSDIAAIHIRYSRRDLHNVILTLSNGNHKRLTVGDTERFVKQLSTLAPELKIEQE